MVMLNVLDQIRPAIHKAILEEAVGRKIPELNEPGWNQLGGGIDALTGLDRMEVNEQARLYYHTDPLARYMVRLHSAYTFARGVSVRAEDDDVNEIVQRFWKNPRNRASISTAKAQWDLSRELQLDGELFLVFYTSTINGQVTVRTIPAEEIRKIEYADGDDRMPIRFYREYYNTATRRRESVAYPDYRFPDANKISVGRRTGTEIAVMHVVSNDFGGRGISELATSIPWIRALKGFMEDRATLTLALATFAFKMKIKGNRQSLERARNQLGAYETEHRYGAEDGRERRQGANFWMQNESADLEQLKTDSGASQAYQDMRMFRQQAGIGTSVFEHYLGDPSTGNLATATAMELPMLKQFEFEQQMWEDIYTDIFGFVVQQGIRFGELRGKGTVEVDRSGSSPIWILEPKGDADVSIDVKFPAIVQKDVAVQMSALQQAKNAEATTGEVLVPAEQAMQLALSLLGYSNEAGEIVEEWRGRDFKKEDEEPETPPEEDNPVQPPPGETPPGNAEENPDEAVEEADDDKKQVPDVGKPLPKKQAEKVEPITKSEIDKAFADWAKLPSLEDLAKELGIENLEDLDDA